MKAAFALLRTREVTEVRESKGELTDRLRREGHWESFVRRREELKAGGMAAGDAWGIAAAEFPPALSAVPPPDRQGMGVPPPDLSCLRDKSSGSMLDDVQWVFDYLDAPWVQPADAPSLGAWSLREWARCHPGNRSEFYTTFVPKMMPTRQQLNEEHEKAQDDDTDLLETIAEMQRVAEKIQREVLEHDHSLARAILADELCPACRQTAEERGIAPAETLEHKRRYGWRTLCG